MTKMLKTAGLAGLLAAGAVAVAASALAGDAVSGQKAPAEKQAIVTQLGGSARAVTYWVRGDKGFEVITTVDAADAEGTRPAVVRVSSYLQPGQQQLVSVPGAAGTAGATLRIVRVADRIEVETASALSY